MKSAFNAVTGITLMGWVKPTGPNPNLNSTTDKPADTYNAVGLFGLLSGTSDGHAVRALLEVIQVYGTPRSISTTARWRSIATANHCRPSTQQPMIVGE